MAAAQFASEQEIEDALSRMDPIAADATRRLADRLRRNPAAMHDYWALNDAFVDAINDALKAAEAFETAPIMATTLRFREQHEDEIADTATEIVLFYVQRDQAKQETGCGAMIMLVGSIGAATGIGMRLSLM